MLGCSRRTLERAASERDALPDDPAAGRVRRPGAGRKKADSQPQLEQNLKSVLEVRTAGDPDDADAAWTDLSPTQIAKTVTAQGTPVSPRVVRDWMKDQGLALHKIENVPAGGQSPDRDARFQRIATLKAEYFEAGLSVFSIDTTSNPSRKTASPKTTAMGR